MLQDSFSVSLCRSGSDSAIHASPCVPLVQAGLWGLQTRLSAIAWRISGKIAGSLSRYRRIVSPGRRSHRRAWSRSRLPSDRSHALRYQRGILRQLQGPNERYHGILAAETASDSACLPWRQVEEEKVAAHHHRHHGNQLWGSGSFELWALRARYRFQPR